MCMDNPALNSYLEETCDKESELLKRIHRDTYLREPKAHMLSGHYQGRVLSMLSKLVRPKQILEIGTFTGYATVCLAEGLQDNGILHTIDINEELQDRLEDYFEQGDLNNKIKLHIGDALQIIPTLSGNFDLVFIDADKKRNQVYFDMIIDRVPSGGLILIDNVLWKGRVFDEKVDSQTKRVLELNRNLAEDARVDKLILPIRDGLLVLRKK